MKHLLALSLGAALPMGALACPRCAPIVRSGVFNGDFWGHLLPMLAPLLVVVLLALALHRLGEPS